MREAVIIMKEAVIIVLEAVIIVKEAVVIIWDMAFHRVGYGTSSCMLLAWMSHPI